MASGINTSYAANKAVIVGVGKYQDSRNNLPGIELDTNMAQQLAARLGVSSSDMKLVMDENATINGMRQAMQWAAKGVSADDTVLIYVSSHGSQVADNNSDEQDGYDETLYLHDGHFTDDEFGQLIKAIPSQNVLVFVDACHSGTVTKSVWSSLGNIFNAKRGVSKFVKPTSSPAAHGLAHNTVHKAFGVEGTGESAAGDNYLLLAAAQDSQQSIATPDGSLFTKALLDTFEKRRGDGRDFTWNDVFNDTKNVIISSDQAFYPNLEGNKQLANKAIRLVNVASSTKPVWRETENMANQGESFGITAPASLVEGQKLDLSFDIPTSGYLNIVTVDAEDNATLLFPNKYVQDNKVSAGTFDLSKNLPFVIKAQKPLGQTLIAAFVTQEPVSLMEKGMGIRNSQGALNANFARLTTATMKKALGVEAKAASFQSTKKIINVTGR
jgi:hypothetical protein